MRSIESIHKQNKCMNEEQIKKGYEEAKAQYASLGIDAAKAIEQLDKLSISIHCWQADDVSGFENPEGELTGGIQTTGNYPGKARTIEELRADLEPLMATSAVNLWTAT